MSKKNIILLILTLILLLPTSLVYGDSELRIESWYVDSELLSNGDVVVTEELTFINIGDANTLFRNISLNSKDGIEGLEVYEIVDGQEVSYDWIKKAKKNDTFVYTFKETRRYDRVQLFFPANEKAIRTYRFNYIVKNVGVKYTDIGQLFYKFVGKESRAPIDYFYGRVTFPQDINDNLEIFLHGPSKGTSNIVGSSILELEVSDIAYGSYFEGRFLFPLDFIGGSSKTDKTTYEKIIKLEQAYTESTDKTAISEERILSLQKNLAYIISGALVLMILFLYKKLRKNPALFLTLESIVPDHLSPGEIRHFMNSSVIDTKALVATILDFYKRGYIEIKETSSEKAGKNEYKFKLLKKSDQDLLSHEDHFLKWLFSQMGDGTTTDTLQIDGRRMKSYRVFATGFTVWTKRIKTNITGRGYFDYKHRLGAIGFIFALAMFFVGIVLFRFGIVFGLLVSLLSIISMALSWKLFSKKTDLGHIQFKLWTDLKKSLMDKNDLLENYSSISYEDALIYSIVLGLSLKDIKDLNKIYKKDISSDHWSHIYLEENAKGISVFEESIKASFYGG